MKLRSESRQTYETAEEAILCQTLVAPRLAARALRDLRTMCDDRKLFGSSSIDIFARDARASIAAVEGFEVVVTASIEVEQPTPP